MPKNTAECGKREERSIVKSLEGKGYSARRQPGSGNRAVDLQHDILWRDSPIGKIHIEAKYRDKSQWRTLEGWQAGADILTVRAARGERMAFLSWDLLLQLVGSAADRSEVAADLSSGECPECHKYMGHCPACHRDLPSVEPDKPWLTEPQIVEAKAMADYSTEILRRARIQSAHQNPPQRKPKPNKLKGRGFGK